MKPRKLLALILCLVLCLTALLACKDEPTDNNDNNAGTPPSTEGAGDGKEEGSELDQYVARARAYYKNACVKITTELTAMQGDTALPGEKTVCFVQGESKTTFTGENLDTVLHIYVDGKLYAPSTKKFYQVPNMPFFTQNYIAPEFHVQFFEAFEYAEVTITKNPDGTVTVSGKSPAEEAKGEVEALFGPTLAMEDATFDYSSLCSELIFDAEGRLIQQSAKMSASSHAGKLLLQQTESYEYGIPYAVNVPADAATYTAVSSVGDLFLE